MRVSSCKIESAAVEGQRLEAGVRMWTPQADRALVSCPGSYRRETDGA
jgi:hypothetical protein